MCDNLKKNLLLLVKDKNMWFWPCGCSAVHGAQRLWRWGNGLCWDRSMVITPASHLALYCRGGEEKDGERQKKKTRGWVHAGVPLWENEKCLILWLERKNIPPFQISSSQTWIHPLVWTCSTLTVEKAELVLIMCCISSLKLFFFYIARTLYLLCPIKSLLTAYHTNSGFGAFDLDGENSLHPKEVI